MDEPRLENDLLDIARPLSPTQADFLETLAFVLALAVGDGISHGRAVEMMERAKHLCDQDYNRFRQVPYVKRS